MAKDYLGYTGCSQRRAKQLLRQNDIKDSDTGHVPGPILNGTQMTPFTCASYYHKQMVTAMTDKEVQACKLTGNTIQACIDLYTESSRRAFCKADIAVDHADYETILKGTQVVISSDSITKPESATPVKSAGDYQSVYLFKSFPNKRGFPRNTFSKNSDKVKNKIHKLRKP